jgi:dTMP kinase
MTAVGVTSYRQMDDRKGIPLANDLRNAFTGTPGVYSATGVFIALEGGEGAGKSTQSDRLAGWLREAGYDVLLTHEPGDTEVGQKLRRIVLDPETGSISDRTETLLYAADKAEHVDRVVAPALTRGAVVITDRYVDSTLAYQGAGRALDDREVERVARWATGDLRPNLTVLLDLPPQAGLTRFAERDRIEGESVEFHERVRQGFLRLASAQPEHYLVLDARRPIDEVAAQIRERVEPLLEQAKRERSGTEDERRHGEQKHPEQNHAERMRGEQSPSVERHGEQSHSDQRQGDDRVEVDPTPTLVDPTRARDQ